MRRITRISKKRKKAEDEAIQTLRRVRKQLDPELLDNMRDIIEAAEQGVEDKEKIEELSRAPECDEFGNVPVDKEKNMAIIMKFLEENRDNTALMHKMKESLLSVED